MKEEKFTWPLFGDKINVLIYNYESRNKNILEEAYQEALRLQKIFNFFDEESELSKLNKKKKLKVSKELLEVIKKSIKLSKLTKGTYDVALGRNILERKNGLEESPVNNSYKDIKIRGNQIELKTDLAIDLGSIAKGYITDRIGNFLRNSGIEEFLIDSRGDILLSGRNYHVLGVQNPRNPEENITKIKLRNISVATSGDYKQFYGNFKKSHLLNAGEVISVTVISKKLEDADAIATALFVSEGKIRQKIMKKNKKCPALVIKKNMEKEFYNKFECLIKQ